MTTRGVVPYVFAVEGKIVIQGLEFEVRLGAFDWERERKQSVKIDLEMEFPFPEHDLLEETVDYSRVVDSLKEILEGEFHLLETLAREVALKVLNSFPMLRSVKVKAHKPHAPIGVKFQDLFAEFST